MRTPQPAQEAPALECSDRRSATEILEANIREWRASDFGSALVECDANRQLVLLISEAQSVIASTNSANFGKSREIAFAKEVSLPPNDGVLSSS